MAYVDEVIRMLDMQEYADAVVGVPGQGLNVEQRKRLTIGVELAAKPPLLLFVDEPTSGLDSQTSWAVLDLLEKLSKAGQSILCTIHQPSAELFQRFDRLLLLADAGKPVYFGEFPFFLFPAGISPSNTPPGDIGQNSKTLIDYFERHGAKPCPPGANPGEWMLEAIGAAPGSHSDIDWSETWRASPEYHTVQSELARLRSHPSSSPDQPSPTDSSSSSSYGEFATPFLTQLHLVTLRSLQHAYRTPTYIYAKLMLTLVTSLFIGLVFLNSALSIQGLQNQMFAIFEMLIVAGQLMNQQFIHFVGQRSLYEVRERPAKTYDWKVFVLAQILAEVPVTFVGSVLMWVCFYFPVGLYKNADAAGQGGERGVLTWAVFFVFLMWLSTFAHLIVVWSRGANEAGQMGNFLFALSFFFCGVLATPDQMPGFWVFMYRASPTTYYVSALLSAGLANVDVTCASNEFTVVDPPLGQTCGEYLGQQVAMLGGYLVDGNATSDCHYCRMRETNAYLAGVDIDYGTRWRDFGIMWGYVSFNLVGALFLYWLARMPKGRKKR